MYLRSKKWNLPLPYKSSLLSLCCFPWDNIWCILSPHRYGDHLRSIRTLRLNQYSLYGGDFDKTFFQKTFVRVFVPGPALGANQINTLLIHFLAHNVLKRVLYFDFGLKNESPAHREPLGLVQLLVDHTDDEDEGDHAEYSHDGDQNFLPSRLKSLLCD